MILCESASQGVYDGVKPAGVDQGSIDSFNFLLRRLKQICKDCEIRLGAWLASAERQSEGRPKTSCT